MEYLLHRAQKLARKIVYFPKKIQKFCAKTRIYPKKFPKKQDLYAM